MAALKVFLPAAALLAGFLVLRVQFIRHCRLRQERKEELRVSVTTKWSPTRPR